MGEKYQAARFGTAWGIFRNDDLDHENPVLFLHDEEAAKDLAIAMNQAATEPEIN